MGRILLQELDSRGKHLEAGCGAGYWVAALRQYGYQVEGVESSDELVHMVKTCQKDIPIRQGDALNLQTSDNYYDSYLSFGVVEHRKEGPEPFIAEAYRVLKPGGKLILSVPAFGIVRTLKAKIGMYAKNATKPFFQYGFSPKELCHIVTKAGFRVKKAAYLHLHRLLLEEIPIYRWIVFQRGGRYVKQMAHFLFNKLDGHMIMVIATKPMSVQ
jgi:SAM-dependent methyltransferase